MKGHMVTSRNDHRSHLQIWSTVDVPSLDSQEQVSGHFTVPRRSIFLWQMCRKGGVSVVCAPSPPAHSPPCVSMRFGRHMDFRRPQGPEAQCILSEGWIPGLCHSNETLTLPSRFIVSRKFCTSPQERYAQWIKGEKSHLGVFSEQEMK
jgi:hypothetical protein